VTLTTDPRPVLDVRRVTKTYGAGETAVRALRGVDLLVQPGEYVAIMGMSGSGKSTLMNVLGCLDVPSGGQYLLDGLDVAEMDEHALALVRNRRIGFVFQAFNLIPRTEAVANVEIPMAYARVPRRERRERAMAALELVGMADRARHRPNELSGGQQQRVAVALLADEPTGNLDEITSDKMLAEFLHLVRGQGSAALVATHNERLAARMDRVVRLHEGLLG